MNVYFQIIVLFITVGLQALPARAATLKEYSCVYRTLSEVAADFKRSLLLSEDLEKMEAIRNSKAMAPVEKNRQIFEVILTARLRGKPEELQRKVWAAYENRVTHETLGDIYAFYSDSTTQAIQLGMTPQFIRSPLEYLIVFHELEHLIQDVALEKAEGLEDVDYSKGILFQIFARYFSEDGAMRAEHLFASQLTKEEVTEVSNLLIADSELSKQIKKDMIAAVNMGYLDSESYLTFQRSNGRYNLENVFDEVLDPMIRELIIDYPLLSGVQKAKFPALKTALAIAALKGVCSKYYDPKLPDDASRIQSICSGFNSAVGAISGSKN